MCRSDPSKPYIAIALDPMGHYLLRAPGSTTLNNVTPVMGEIQPGADVDTLRGVARELAGDVLNQFGVATLQLYPQS